MFLKIVKCYYSGIPLGEKYWQELYKIIVLIIFELLNLCVCVCYVVSDFLTKICILLMPRKSHFKLLCNSEKDNMKGNYIIF